MKSTDLCLVVWHVFIMMVIVMSQLSIHLEAAKSRRQVQFMKTRELTTPIFKLVIDNRNGDVLVGSRDWIHRLSHDDLAVIDNVRTGPASNSIDHIDNDILVINHVS